MLLLPLPRRHRRRLLLPPGLLALAWLLWLGCVAVPQLRGMRPHHVMEVTFPELHFRDWQQDSPEYLPPAKLAAFRPWQTTTVTGNLFADDFALRYVQAVMRSLGDDSNHERGLRVILGQQATYNNIIQLLDWCNVYSIKNHWIDFRREPHTLYIVTYKPKLTATSDKPLTYFGCGGGSAVSTSTETESWSKTFIPLLTSDWRNAVLLLLLIGSISAYRLGRGWLTR